MLLSRQVKHHRTASHQGVGMGLMRSFDASQAQSHECNLWCAEEIPDLCWNINADIRIDNPVNWVDNAAVRNPITVLPQHGKHIMRQKVIDDFKVTHVTSPEF